MRAALVLVFLAFLAWATWPAPLPALEPEDAEAIRLIRDLQRRRPGAWAAMARARNPRTVPALMALEPEEVLDGLLHHPDKSRGDERTRVPELRLAGACCDPGRPHSPVDTFDGALQAGILQAYGGSSLKQRSCARWGSPAYAALEEKLNDAEPGVRFAAAFQIWRSELPRLVPRALATLGEHAFVRYGWLDPVAEIVRRETSGAALLEGIRKGRRRDLAAAAFLKRRELVEEIVRQLDDPARKEAWPDLAFVLGEIGDPRAVPALARALQRGDLWLTGDAAEALEKIGDPAALPALREALDGAGVYGQAAILRALGRFGRAEDVPRVERYAVSDEYTGAIGRRRIAQDVLRKLRP